MTYNELTTIVKECKFEGMTFEVIGSNGTGLFVMGLFPDGLQVWKTRKWVISSFATRSEVVQTMLKLVLTAMEHEAREKFTYKGKAIFGPHFDVERLLFMADSPHDVRSEFKHEKEANSPQSADT